MAIYHCSISNVSRSAGSSACATLSYITAKAVYEERTSQIYNYGRTERVYTVGTILPDSAPEEWKDPAKLFNSIENYETAENARTAKKIEVALPREFTMEISLRVIEQYIVENLTKAGYAATYAIHTDKENKNPHVHILVANRQINKKGWVKSKTRKEYALDGHGQRIPLIDPTTGKQKLGKRNEKLWKRVTVEQNLLDKKAFLRQLRENWAAACNRELVPTLQIDHRTLAEQGIERIPTIHEGYASRKIEARGGVSDRAEINREIRERNKILDKLKIILQKISNRISKLLDIRDQIEIKNSEMFRIRQFIRDAAEEGIISKSLTDVQKNILKQYEEKMIIAFQTAQISPQCAEKQLDIIKEMFGTIKLKELEERVNNGWCRNQVSLEISLNWANLEIKWEDIDRKINRILRKEEQELSKDKQRNKYNELGL